MAMYWMHLEVASGATLATLDHFLRETWLECCGHLSAFEIGGVRYSVDAGMYEWDTGGKNMQVRLENVLKPGQTCSYEYDFGSTTEPCLYLVVISFRFDDKVLTFTRICIKWTHHLLSEKNTLLFSKEKHRRQISVYGVTLCS